MKILLIEDEQDFVDRLKELSSNYVSIDLVTPSDMGSVFEIESDDDQTLEEQLTEHLRTIVQENHIDLILLDTDLSRNKNLRSQTEYRYSLAEIGIPTLRYRK